MSGLWEKTKKYLFKIYMKAVTDKGTPEYIARGWAIGMFIGFAMPFGAQLIVSIPLSFLLKGSKIGAAVGTLVTNHVTIFFIYPVQCWIGNKLIGGKLSIDFIRQQLTEVAIRQEYKVLFDLGWELVLSFFIGGFLFAVISTPICYAVVKRLIIRYREIREKRRQAKTVKAAEKAEQERTDGDKKGGDK